MDLLIRCDAFPEPTFLWWDVRPQPRFGTVEVRILDAQTTVAETAALAALVQCIARLEIEEGYVSEPLVHTHEALDENRFLAARDGMHAELIDPGKECRVPALELLGGLLEACEPHASDLGCTAELRTVSSMAGRTGAQRQLDIARAGGGLGSLVGDLAGAFVREGYTLDDVLPGGPLASAGPGRGNRP